MGTNVFLAQSVSTRCVCITWTAVLGCGGVVLLLTTAGVLCRWRLLMALLTIASKIKFVGFADVKFSTENWILTQKISLIIFFRNYFERQHKERFLSVVDEVDTISESVTNWKANLLSSHSTTTTTVHIERPTYRCFAASSANRASRAAQVAPCLLGLRDDRIARDAPATSFYFPTRFVCRHLRCRRASPVTLAEPATFDAQRDLGRENDPTVGCLLAPF